MGGRDFKDVTNVIPFSLREVASSIEFVLIFRAVKRIEEKTRLFKAQPAGSY